MKKCLLEIIPRNCNYSNAYDRLFTNFYFSSRDSYLLGCEVNEGLLQENDALR